MNTLKVSDKQLRVIQNALELYARIGIGQFDRVLDEFWDIKGDRQTARRYLDMAHVEITGYPANAGISISMAESKFKIAWDIYRIIRKNLFDKNPYKVAGFTPVDGDPVYRLSDETLPVLENE